MDATDREFLAKLPTLDWFEWQGHHFRMAHATPQGDMYEYLPVERWGERIAGLGEDFLLLGHTHVQGIRSFGDVTVVNPGRVGLARDGGGEACYAVHEDGRLELKRIPYDVHRTVAARRSSPLPSEVVQGLESVLRPGAKVGSS